MRKPWSIKGMVEEASLGRRRREQEARLAVTIARPWLMGDGPCVLRDGESAYHRGYCASCQANPIAISQERRRQQDEATRGDDGPLTPLHEGEESAPVLPALWSRVLEQGVAQSPLRALSPGDGGEAYP